MKHIIVLFCGMLFGAGMALSGMTDTAKVIGFLDLTGNWDPTLMFVMGGGLLVTVPFFQFGLVRMEKPVFGDNFRVPLTQIIDWKLIGGGAIFGLGWGIYGYCPGPAVASLAYGNIESIIFICVMALGMVSADLMLKTVKSHHINLSLGRK